MNFSGLSSFSDYFGIRSFCRAAICFSLWLTFAYTTDYKLNINDLVFLLFCNGKWYSRANLSIMNSIVLHLFPCNVTFSSVQQCEKFGLLFIICKHFVSHGIGKSAEVIRYLLNITKIYLAAYSTYKYCFPALHLLILKSKQNLLKSKHIIKKINSFHRRYKQQRRWTTWPYRFRSMWYQ